MTMIRFFIPPIALAAALTGPAYAAAPAKAQQTQADTFRELETFMGIFERVRATYVDQVDDHTLIKGAIDGMLNALDPHSSYAELTDFDALKTTTDGNYGGLGITVSQEDGAVKVITATEDTPADRAGIKPGDYITHIDGTLLYGMTLDEAVEKMKGSPGTRAAVTIVRVGATKPIQMSIVREKIVLKPVKWEVKDRIGVVNINTFNANTGAGVADAIKQIDKKLNGQTAGYVIDLRSNPGGLLDQAVEVSDAFLESGEVVSERGRDKDDIQRFYAKPGDLARGLPLIVLVDAGSASAAEIVAAALQDHRRALVMGERSFGKGSVQTVMQLGPRAALRLTTARYFTPSGRSVQAGGVNPDIVVPQLSDPDYKDRPRLREADLRRALAAVDKIEDAVLEEDVVPDPRLLMTAADLKAKGIKDFQLDYAVKTLMRTAMPAQVIAQIDTKAAKN